MVSMGQIFVCLHGLHANEGTPRVYHHQVSAEIVNRGRKEIHNHTGLGPWIEIL